MWSIIKRMFGYGSNEQEFIGRVDVPISPPPAPISVENTDTDRINTRISAKRRFNSKNYVRRGNKFYRHGGFDDDFEIVDLILLELLMESFEAGDIEDWKEPEEQVENILDVDVDTIPVEAVVETTPTSVDTNYTPEPVVETYTEPERTSSYGGGSSYDSGSSDSSDSGGSDD